MSLKDNATWKAVKPFMNGGLSGMGATCIIQPLDIVKVRTRSARRIEEKHTHAGPDDWCVTA